MRNGIRTDWKDRMFVRFSDKSHYDTYEHTDKVDFNKSITYIDTDKFGSTNLSIIGRRIARMITESYPTIRIDGNDWGIGYASGESDVFYKLYNWANELRNIKKLDNSSKIQFFDDTIRNEILCLRHSNTSVSDKQKIRMCDNILKHSNFYEFAHQLECVTDAPNLTTFYNDYFMTNRHAVLSAKNRIIDFSKLTVFERNYLLLWYESLLHDGDNRIVLINLPEIGLPITLQKEFIMNLNMICNKLHWQAIVVTLSDAIISGFEDRIVQTKIKRYV